MDEEEEELEAWNLEQPKDYYWDDTDDEEQLMKEIWDFNNTEIEAETPNQNS